ncbi:MAG: hypothetical protein QGI83_20170 [Candidatus Latescibacteria bacterium]|nr:hypothetical protein [Candidatus Latescibacterota bacterium]
METAKTDRRPGTARTDGGRVESDRRRGTGDGKVSVREAGLRPFGLKAAFWWGARRMDHARRAGCGAS